MAGAEGWIKLHRNIQEHWIWSDAEKLKWWLDIILLANHQDNKFLLGNEVVKIERGARHTSEILLSERWKVSRKTVRSFLKLLESDGMITTKKTTKGTTFKVTNYNVYQGFFSSEGTTKGTTKGTTEEHQKVQRRDNEGTSEGTTEGTQTIMNKKDKNEKNDKRMREKEEEKSTPPKREIEKVILKRFGEVAFGTWFLPSEIIEEATKVTIKNNDAFAREIIKKRYVEELGKVLNKEIILEG
ncbi:MAG: hypothetical protein ACRC30_10960 [Clostridium sp.]